MKRRGKRIIVAALACFAALVFARTAVAMPALETGGSTSSAAVRPDDRTGVRGVVGQAQLSHSLSSISSEHSFGASQPVQPQATSSGSDYNWGRTIGISAAALALALCLVGLTIVGLRQRRPLHV
jgi:hypothetical protein